MLATRPHQDKEQTSMTSRYLTILTFFILNYCLCVELTAITLEKNLIIHFVIMV